MIYAMFSLVMLTLFVTFIGIFVRVKSVVTGRVRIKYYRTMSGQEVPDIIVKSTRCFNNLFEVPVLFYVVATLFVSLDIHSATAVVLAWLFVVFRVLQAIIHLTYNNVTHRMLMFWGGILSVMSLWIVLVISIS